MKYALVLTGMAREFQAAFPSIKQYILDRYNPDVYISIWSEKGAYSGANYIQQPNDQFIKLKDGDKGFNVSGEKVNLNKLVELYNPVAMEVDEFSAHEDKFEFYASKFSNAYSRPKNTMSMFFKIYRGMSLVQYNGIQYDRIIRMRPDMQFNSDPGDFGGTKFITHRHSNKFAQGTSDGFQIGTHKDMHKFGMAWAVTNKDGTAILEKAYEELGVSCPHLFTKWIIDLFNLDHEERFFEFCHCHSPNGPYTES